MLTAVLCLPAAARVGHELSFYPSFYPQEIMALAEAFAVLDVD